MLGMFRHVPQIKDSRLVKNYFLVCWTVAIEEKSQLEDSSLTYRNGVEIGVANLCRNAKNMTHCTWIILS